MQRERGRFIVIYGPNNIGKSTQLDLLEEKFSVSNIPLVRVKYPIYNLDPTGICLNEILRKGNPHGYTAEQTQKIFADNRRDYEHELEQILDSGSWVLAEDYKGTGMAWGLTFGVSFSKLQEFNNGLIEEDLAICLDGERYTSGIERGHLHEQSDKWELNRRIHQELSRIFGWEIVNANQPKEMVHNEIWQKIQDKFEI